MSRAGLQMLGDVGEVTMGLSPAGDTYRQDGIGVPLLNGPTEFGAHHPIPATWTDVPTRISQTGDLLFCVRGSTTGRMNWSDGAYCIGRGLASIRARTGDQRDTYFIYCAILEGMERLLGHTTGSVFPSISKSDFSGFLIPWPEVSQRRAISSILSAFDDKIELNRRTAETLEAMARAVFKSWFVDFDPVHAKAAGRLPEWMDAETAALFPDRFGEDGLPEGWIESFGADLFDVTKGRSYKKAELQPSEIALVTLKSFNRNGGYARRGLKPYTGDYNPNQIVLPGEIVMACTDLTQAAEVIGRPAIVEASEFDTLVASLDVLVIRPVPQWLTNEWLYWLLNEPRSHEHMRSYANGSTVLHLSKEAVPTLPCVVPPESVVLAFTALIRPWMERSRHGRNQNAVLEHTRDALLPRLLSGELRVDDAEKVAEGVL